MLARLIGLVFILWPTLAHALPDELLRTLAPVSPPQAWLAQAPLCSLAALQVLGPYRPFECFPPMAATIGFHSDGSSASFESKRDPGCGEHLPETLVRTRPDGRPTQTLPLAMPSAATQSDDTLAQLLSSVFFASMRLIVDGFRPPLHLIEEETQVYKGNARYRAAVLLGPPLTGYVLWLDVPRSAVMLEVPGRLGLVRGGWPFMQRLGSIPKRPRGFPSIDEVVLAPDGQRLIVRIARVEGSPCDPTAQDRLVLRLPPRRPAQGLPAGWGQLAQRCQANDLGACQQLCDLGRCAPLVERQLDQGTNPPQAAATSESLRRACRGGEIADCIAQERLRGSVCRQFGERSDPCFAVTDMDDMGMKGGPMPVRIEQRLIRACARKTDPLPCVALVRGAIAKTYRVTRDDAQAAKARALKLLSERCANDDAHCAELEAVKALVVP